MAENILAYCRSSWRKGETMINTQDTIFKLLSDTPALTDFFAARGLPADTGDPRIKRLTLKSVLAFKHIDEERFRMEAELFLTEYASRLREQDDPNACDMLVRIPCVVQLPIEEALNKFIGHNVPGLKHNTELVEFGADWLTDLLKAHHPPVIIGGGIEGMVNQSALMEEYEAPAGELNPDFAGMEDPRGVFKILSGIPLVMVVDETQLNGRKAPNSIAELLSGRFQKSVIYPDDGHMLDGVLLYYFYLAGGMNAVDALKNACICGVHPSQMIKYGGIEEKPAVMLMPYIFAEIKSKEPGMRVVWPQEGAPLIPILECVHKCATLKQRTAAEYLAGEQIGSLFMGQGMFPSSHPGVKNNLPGRIWFAGWDNVYSDNLPKLLPKLKEYFLED